MLIFGIGAFAVTRVNHHPSQGWDGIYWPALIVLGIAMAGMGASDEVSAIFRSSMIIQAAPDEMRGRLQGVFIVVVTGGRALATSTQGSSRPRLRCGSRRYLAEC